jgi:hypothetical protein
MTIRLVVNTPESAVSNHFTFAKARLLRLSIILINISYPPIWLLLMSVFFDIAGGKCFQLVEKSFVIDIVCAITGKVHTDQPVYPVDRAITHIDRLVRLTQTFELLQYRQRSLLIYYRLQVVYLAVTKLVEESRTQYLFQHEYAVTKGVIGEPAG